LVKSWILLLIEEYGFSFDYLPRNKNDTVVAYDLSHLDIHSLKIQEETGDQITLLSGSENSRISNIK
jgi:hypothetical protein